MTASSSCADSSPPSGRAYWIAWVVVAAIVCVPVWLTHIPPLSDYYNHLARLYILGHYDQVAAYQEIYAVDWSASPNLALELIGLPMLAVMSLATTAKVFLTLTIVLWHLGCTMLGRAIYGRFTRRALVCSFFVYNQQFLHGYCNFLFSMGLALIALALWIDSRERWSWPRVVVLTLLCTQVFLAHLAGFATLGLAVAALLVVRMLARRRIDWATVLGALPLVPGTLWFFAGFLRQTSGSSSGTAFAPLLYNVRDSMSLLTGYHQLVDLASIGVVLVLVALVLILGSLGTPGTRMGVRGDIAAAAGCLVVVYWICPSDLASGLEVNVRFLLGAGTLGAFAVDAVLTRRARTMILALALLLFSARTVTTAAFWMELDAQFQEHRRAFAKIEEGAAVHNIYFYPAPRLLNARRVEGLALIHSLSFAAVERSANVPTLYAIHGQQPLAHRTTRYRAHRFRDGQQPEIPWSEVFTSYQYVWACRPPPEVIEPLVQRATVVAEAGSCKLYRI